MTRSTRDAICRGEITVLQPEEGYRFNVDALILAHFAFTSADAEPSAALDLGAGCGVVGLLLARRWPTCRVLLVELQAELVALAAENIELNGLAPRVESLRADLRDLDAWAPRWEALGRGRRTIVVNPPFFRLGEGRPSPDRQVAAARHEVSCTLEQILGACSAGLQPGDSVAMIHAARRRGEVLEGLAETGFGACLVRGVKPLPRRSSARILVHATRGASRSAHEVPPLVVEEEPGRYSEEMKRALGESPMDHSHARRPECKTW
jgi:tRNA1Val (adenine37-N6)-methyltransferase